MNLERVGYEPLTIETMNDEGANELRVAIVAQQVNDAARVIVKGCEKGYSNKQLDGLLYDYWKWFSDEWCHELLMGEIPTQTLYLGVLEKANDTLVRRTFAKNKIYSTETGQPPARTKSGWEELGYIVTGKEHTPVPQYRLVRGKLKKYFENYYRKSEVEKND